MWAIGLRSAGSALSMSAAQAVPAILLNIRAPT